MSVALKKKVFTCLKYERQNTRPCTVVYLEGQLEKLKNCRRIVKDMFSCERYETLSVLHIFIFFTSCTIVQ